MPRVFLYAGIVLVGCASRPDFSSVSTNSVSMQPAVELHDDAPGHQHVASGGQAVLVSQSVASDDDVWTPRRSGADVEPDSDAHSTSLLPNWTYADAHTLGQAASNPHGACLLPNWSPDEANSATSDKAAVPLPNYVVEKEVPPADTDLKTAQDPSARPRKSPFMLLRLTETKNPPFRQW